MDNLKTYNEIFMDVFSVEESMLMVILLKTMLRDGIQSISLP